MLPGGKVKKFPVLAGWGRYPSVDSQAAVRPEKFRDLTPVGDKTLARGKGRSYGDAALLTGGTLVLTEKVNRILAFDQDTGLVRAEAGVTIKDLLDALVPRGWFVPVTPGTKHCTLGGCIAADVHGKNHHRDGTISAHIRELSMVLANGEEKTVTPDDPLFWATVGGMGLTGIIREVSLQMIPVETAYMKVRHIRTKNLDQTVGYFLDQSYDAKYSVAWIDCLARGSSLGKGVLMLGEHARKPDLSLRIDDPLKVKPKRPKPFPIELPNWALNPVTIKLFNSVYSAFQGGRGEFVSSYDAFFYPLDGIDGWSKMYGKRGFLQYQYVMPMETALQGTREVLEQLSGQRKASFLAVLKKFGAQGPGMLSFPIEGLTLALDIPMSEGLLPFLDQLDKVVLKHGGRIYLAKDSRMDAAVFKAGYPRLGEFCAIRNEVDPDHRFNSDLARRLSLCQ